MAVRPLLSAPTMRSHIPTAITIRAVAAAIAASSVDAIHPLMVRTRPRGRPRSSNTIDCTSVQADESHNSWFLTRCVLNSAPCIVVLGTLHFCLGNASSNDVSYKLS